MVIIRFYIYIVRSDLACLIYDKPGEMLYSSSSGIICCPQSGQGAESTDKGKDRYLLQGGHSLKDIVMYVGTGSRYPGA